MWAKPMNALIVVVNVYWRLLWLQFILRTKIKTTGEKEHEMEAKKIIRA